MPVSDPVGDLLTRIRNANSANHESLEVDSSNLKVEVLRILHEEGYIKSYEVITQPVQNKIKVTLKYGARNRGKSHHRTEAGQQAWSACLSVA